MVRGPKSDEVVALLTQISENLSVIRRLLELSLRRPVKEELEKIVSTTERKKIWALSNGTTSTSEIAKQTGVSTRAVRYFVREMINAGLMRMDKRGFPCRTIDWIPPEWEQKLKEKLVEEVVKENEAEQQDQNQERVDIDNKILLDSAKLTRPKNNKLKVKSM